MPTQRHITYSAAAALVMGLTTVAPAVGEPQQRQVGNVERTLAQAPAPAQPAPQGTVTKPPPSGIDTALQRRVEQIEEQLVDMQVVVGTLESLARSDGRPPRAVGGAATGAMSAADKSRISGLETQVRALAAQIEQLTAQVRALASAPQRAAAGAPAGDTPNTSQPQADRFGSTTVTAGTNDAIAGLIDGQPQEQPAAPLQEAANAETIAATPPAFMPPSSSPEEAANPKQLYETAYGYLMQRDYGAAQSAFEKFLVRYPKDSLAGNAQYWLGEAHFVRGEYKAAAGAFLKGYQNYAGNARAADSLLKLAMSLDRLGQKDAACTSFAELSTRFPDAPDNVKSRAKAERQRIGCR